MYISPLFRGAYRYAKKIGADKVYILSAKYGLLEETDMIEPYNETLNTKSVSETKKWALNVLATLSQKTNVQTDEFVFLAGEKYRRYLVENLHHILIPLKGMSIGKQLAFYKANV